MKTTSPQNPRFRSPNSSLASPIKTNRRAFTPRFAAVLSALVLGLASAPAARAITVGDPNHPENLMSAIQTAYNSGNKQITITPGMYQQSSSVVVISNLSGATITATGVHLMPAIYSQVNNYPKANQFAEDIIIKNCTSCTFDGFTLQNAVPVNPQGTIMAIGTDGSKNYVDVQLHAGYPADPSLFAQVAYIFDQNTHTWKVNCGASYGNTITTGPNGWTRVYLAAAFSATAVGDFLGGRGPNYHLLDDQNCTNCTFKNMTVYYGGLFQFVETNGSANIYQNLVVTYGPTPSGASIAPLMSTIADAFHSVNDTVGPTVQNCNFQGMPDDAISIHGTSYPIYSVPDASHLIVKGSNFAANDPIYVEHTNPNYFVGDTCSTVTPIATPNGAPAGSYYNLALKTALSSTPPAGALVYASNRIGSGFNVSNNIIANNGARGIRILASNGVVQNNTITGTINEAILVIQPLSSGGGEAGVAQNVQFTGNTITGTGLGFGFRSSAINVDPYIPVAQNLTISGNTIQDNYGKYGISMADTSADTISNNLILNGGSTPFVIASSAVTVNVLGNTFINNGATFTLTPTSAPGYSLDVAGNSPADGTAVDLYQTTGGYNDQWQTLYDGNGLWELAPQLTPSSRLDVIRGLDMSGTHVQQFKTDGDTAQKWTFLNNGDGTVSLQPQCAPDLRLEVSTTGQTNGIPVQIYTATGDSTERWTLTQTNLVTNGLIYTLAPACAPLLRLDVAGGSLMNMANVDIASVTNATYQEWLAIDKGNGLWQFEPQQATGDRLDVIGGGKQSPTNVQQYPADGATAQLWSLFSNGDGTLSLQPLCAPGLYLDTYNSGSTSPTNVQIYTATGGQAQRWTFTVVLGSSITPGEYMLPGEYLVSPDGQHILLQQGDGNLVLYNGVSPQQTTGVVWSSKGTSGGAACYTTLQTDGNLVTYYGTPASRGGSIWSSGTYGQTVTALQLTNTPEAQLVNGAAVVKQYP